MQQVKWAEFELQELFEKVSVKPLKYKAKDLPKTPSGCYNLPALTCTTSNQGLSCYVPKEEATILKNVLTIASNGDAGTTFYQAQEFTVLQDAYAIKGINDDFSPNVNLFLTSIINCILRDKYNWNNKATWEKVKKEKIQLPIIRDGEIDFDFMENFIAELNAQRLAELNVYLSVTGLKDYTLSIAEQQALKDFEQGKIVWAEFELQELFEIKNTLSFNKDRLVSGEEYDYITRTSQNQGVLQTTGFVNKENINPASTWSLGLLQMDFFYREKPWYAGQFVRKIVPKIDLSKKVAVFFSTILNKQKQSLLSVLVRDVDAVFEKTKISLPIKPNSNLDKISQIDFAFMQTFISAVQKLVIKDVVLYADREIAATEQIIQQ